MSIIGNPILLNSGGNGGELNIFYGMTEPTEKHGIWIKSEEVITDIVQDNDVWTPDTFYRLNDLTPTDNFFNNYAYHQIFYYNGYIYKFQSDASRKGLYKAPIDTAIFINFVPFADSNLIPYFGVAQDPDNPRYLYGITGSSSSSNQGAIRKYDLETGEITTIVSGLYTLQWGYSSQSAVVYDGHFYGFYTNSSLESSKPYTPYGIFKFNLNDEEPSLYVDNFINTSDFSCPRMVRVGSDLYIIHLLNNVLKAKKVDLINNVSSELVLTGDTTIESGNISRIEYTTDGSNKIYFMCPYSTPDKKLRILDVDTGIVSSHTIDGTLGGYNSSIGLLYNNGNVYLYGISVSNQTDYEIFQFKLKGKSYPTGTVVITRAGNSTGAYESELISPNNRPDGAYNLFKTRYNMAYQSINGQLVETHSVYNGDGNSWTQIR